MAGDHELHFMDDQVRPFAKVMELSEHLEGSDITWVTERSFSSLDTLVM